MQRTPVDKWVSEKLGVPVSELNCQRLETYQLERVRELIAYAKDRGAFYKEAYRDVDPASIHTMADISRLPTVCEADLAGSEYRFQCVSPSEVHRIYGYLWNETRDQWLVDPEAAEMVKRIFAMTIDGYGPYQIATKLSEEKVLIPSAYEERTKARTKAAIEAKKAAIRAEDIAKGVYVPVSSLPKREPVKANI